LEVKSMTGHRSYSKLKKEHYEYQD